MISELCIVRFFIDVSFRRATPGVREMFLRELNFFSCVALSLALSMATLSERVSNRGV